MSLSDNTVAVMLPISDPESAREFYSDSLGLSYEGTNGEQSLLYRLAGGTQLVLLPRPDQEPSPSTALSFEVSDIQAEVAALEGRGVKFEDYDLPDIKTVDHICVMGSEKAAWFRDPHGNVICLHQEV